MTPNQTQGISLQKYPTYLYCSALRSQIFIRFALRTTIFEIFHILGFPVDSHVKISKCHNIFKFWQIAKMCHNVLFTHNYLIYHKVWLRSDENWRRNSILKFLLPWGPMLTKTKKNLAEK